MSAQIARTTAMLGLAARALRSRLAGSGIRWFHSTAGLHQKDSPPPDDVFKFDDIFVRNKIWCNTKRDARVPANEIMGMESGEVFVQRNIANMVISTDGNATSVIQYAVDFLQVPHIVVCGHYDCGGVRAALKNMNHGSPLENWLRSIRDVWRLHREELSTYAQGESRVRRLVELNVAEQCLNVYKNAVVQKKRYETKLQTGVSSPIIHGLVYDVANGELKRVPIDLHQKQGELRECYDLYDFDEADHTKSIV